jgi:uncharacterized protein (TIGR02246 family)
MRSSIRSPDEKQIRGAIAEWCAATMAGDAVRLRPLMDQDVVFLGTGLATIRGRDLFLGGLAGVFARFRIEPSCEIQEIQVSGNLAYCWNTMSVKMTPTDGSKPMHRTGPILTVFKKTDQDRWVVLRDANMLAFVENDY